MIKYKNRIKQVLDFRGVGDSKIHPSDIDAVLEFDNKYLIIFEVKLKGVQVPFGQRLLFERIVNCWQKNNGEAFIVYCEHETNTEEIIQMENTTVVNVYHNKKNHARNENIKNFLLNLAEHYKIDKLKKAL
jgi:hypothetical protein